MDGLFDFKYETQLSRLREEYLMHFLESGLYADVFKTQVSAPLKPETRVDSLKSYVQLALPYHGQKSTLNSIKDIDKAEIESIKKRLAEANNKRAKPGKT